MSKEIIINHDEIRDPQTITKVVENKFREKGLNCRINEVESLDDCHKTGRRRLVIKNTKYFFT